MAAVGLILQVAGLGLSLYGQSQQTAAMKRAEDARNKQMNLDAQRRRRDVIRNAVYAQAQARNTAASQGALYGSAYPGGQGQISGRAGNQTVESSQNQEIGSDIFAANKDYYNASVYTDIGAGLGSLGGMLVNNAGTIKRVGQNGYF